MTIIIDILWKFSSIGLHLIGTVVYGFTLIYLEFINDRSDPRSTYVGDFKYMTYWNLIFQFMFNGLSLWADLHTKNKYIKNMRQFNDWFFYCVASPFSLFVCLSFWILNLLDKKNVRNPNVQNRYPEWINHVTHTTNCIMNGLELMLTYHSRPGQNHSILVTMLLFASYETFVYMFGKYTDIWIYPFLERISWTKRIFFALIGGIQLLFYFIASIYLGKRFWPKHRIQRFQQIMA